MVETGPPTTLLGQEHKGFDARAAVQIALGAVLLLVLFGAELRQHFGLRLDSLITVAVVWWVVTMPAGRRAEAVDFGPLED